MLAFLAELAQALAQELDRREPLFRRHGPVILAFKLLSLAERMGYPYPHLFHERIIPFPLALSRNNSSPHIHYAPIGARGLCGVRFTQCKLRAQRTLRINPPHLSPLPLRSGGGVPIISGGRGWVRGPFIYITYPS